MLTSRAQSLFSFGIALVAIYVYLQGAAPELKGAATTRAFTPSATAPPGNLPQANIMTYNILAEM